MMLSVVSPMPQRRWADVDGGTVGRRGDGAEGDRDRGGGSVPLFYFNLFCFWSFDFWFGRQHAFTSKK